MEARPIVRPFITPFEDSRRWERVPYRDDDIVISTPPKCGTTWTQRIVMSLLWPDDDTPGTRGALSPWVDIRASPVDDMAAQLAGQEHRRFIKTHTPADGIPLDPNVKYVLVYRSAADALVSWGNHRSSMRAEVVEALNGEAADDGIEGVPTTFEGDYDELLVEWTSYWSPAIHLAPWWPLRHEPNVHVMHYRDMDADLSGEMATLATFLSIAVADDLWTDTVERCRLGAMRTEAKAAGFNDRLFTGGAESFYFKGGVGRGSEILTTAQLEAVHGHVAELLPEDACTWLEAGGPVP
ncbi:MAG: sulfotransferase domain-containing protein [Actinomycetota bacterium]